MSGLPALVEQHPLSITVRGYVDLIHHHAYVMSVAAPPPL